MQAIKKNDFKTCVMLVKHGISVKLNMAMMILFILLGIMGELVVVFLNTANRLATGLDFGALLLFCAAMYPTQILMSANLTGMVQASPYKKKLQTTAPALLSLGGNLIAIAVILLIRGLGVWAMPHRAAEIMSGLVTVGLLVLGIDVLASVIYKFFYLSMAVYLVLCTAWGTGIAYQGANGNGKSLTMIKMGSVPAPAAIAFCLAMVFLGAAVQYLLGMAAYKHPLAKAAFGNNAAKKLV